MKRCVAPGISWCSGVSGGTVISPIVNQVEWIELWQRYNATASVILFKCVLVSPIDDRVEWMVFFELRYRYGALKCGVAAGVSCHRIVGGVRGSGGRLGRACVLDMFCLCFRHAMACI